MPYDALSVATLGVSACLLVAAAMSRRSVALRLGCVLLAALLLRADAANQRSLHVWDESFHALVARNLIETPLRPVLYRAPALPYDSADWTANHIWLHKPPAALWLMAGSMRLFGINEIALRVPSVLLSTLSVILTFLIARELLGTRPALLAAGFHAVNGFLIALAAGRRVADHVDTGLLFFVELAVFLAILFSRCRRWEWLVLAGASVGAGLLTKTWPALVVLPVAFACFTMTAGVRQSLIWSATMLAAAAAVAGPWTWSTWNRFPIEAAAATSYTLQHIGSVVEEQRTAWWTYLADLPRFFGELTPVGLAFGVASTAGSPRRPESRLLIVWLAVPYLVFSLVSTRLPAYVMIAAPAVFMLLAAGIGWGREQLPVRGWGRRGGQGILVLMVLLPGRFLLEPGGPMERRDRSPTFARELERLDERLGLADAVLFNVPKPIDTMFYTGYTAYERLPTDDEVRDLLELGRPVVIYQRTGAPVAIPRHWRVIELREVE